ncbi:MAG: RepB family plasmid replication initiator protein [Thiothrix sp.]|nr:MAG: RepB family plasmid replication initiator protein [Thiothrix sp.]
MKINHLPKEKVIIQHNLITSGRYDFSACQLDILFLLLASLEKNDPEDKKYDLHISDIETITGRKWNHNQLKESTKQMGGNTFVVGLASSEKQLWLFKSVEYQHGKGYFTVSISEEARPYLFELKDNFTRINLNSILSFSSKYAKRIYAIACQWKTAGKVTMDISEFKEILGIKDKEAVELEQFTRISDLKKKVLDIAKTQINESSEINIDYELIKRSRSFEQINLFVNHGKEKRLIDFNESIDFQKSVAIIMNYGVSEPSAIAIARTHYQDFLKLIEQMKKQIKNGVVFDDHAAYIVSVFQKKGVLKLKKH